MLRKSMTSLLLVLLLAAGCNIPKTTQPSTPQTNATANQSAKPSATPTPTSVSQEAAQPTPVPKPIKPVAKITPTPAQQAETPSPSPSTTTSGFDYSAFMAAADQLNLYPVGIENGVVHSGTTCPAIQESQFTRDNVFWIYTDKLDAFVAQYGIGMHTSAVNSVLEDVFNKWQSSTDDLRNVCAQIGYPLPN